jgi:NitT/TauT family transport system ATP-binding protein
LVLDDLSFEINQSERIAFVGPSGCGKSTLLKILAGLESPDQMDLSVSGTSTQNLNASLDISYVFQEANLLPWRNVADNVALPLECHHQKVSSETISDILHRVHLDGQELLFPDELSGGMKMRVSLARAMVTQPEVLLLDEPFGALDELTREDMGLELMQLWEHRSPTTLLITHDVEEAMFLSDRVIVMGKNPGRFLESFHLPWAQDQRELKLKERPEFFKIKNSISSSLRGLHHE